MLFIKRVGAMECVRIIGFASCSYLAHLSFGADFMYHLDFDELECQYIISLAVLTRRAVVDVNRGWAPTSE